MMMIVMITGQVTGGKCCGDNTISQKNPSCKTANVQGSG